MNQFLRLWPTFVALCCVFAPTGATVNNLSDRTNRSVSVYTAAVNNGTLYPTLLGGSSVLDGVYDAFNSTGLMALGGVLLAAGSKFYQHFY